MLTAHHLSKSYGIQTILEDVSFSIDGQERVGLIGPNGCGKSTLLRILAGLEAADSGTVAHTQRNLAVGYLAQGSELSPGTTIREAMGTATADDEAEKQDLAAALAVNAGDAQLQYRYDRALSRLSSDQSEMAVLASLGLAALNPDTPLAHLSGGQKTRLMLARVLAQQPALLLLDEPTNHLDIDMLRWLEQWLEGFRGAALIVSHDRKFLDNTVERILDFNPETHRLRSYAGNYSTYLELFTRERENAMADFQDQEAEIRRLKRDIVRTKEQARHVEITTTPRQPGVRRIAKKVAAKAKAREHKLDRYLSSDERLDRPKASWQIKLEFDAPVKGSREVLKTDDLSIGYPGSSPLLSHLNLRVRHGDRIAITGSNGSGKTTLLRTLAGRLEPLQGHTRLGANVRLGFMAQEQESLDPQESPLQAMQATATFSETDARNLLHYFLFSGDEAIRPSGELSFGERARLQLALLVAGGSSLLLLDEPVNHLDIPSRSRFEEALSGFNGTVLAVVHDRYFIDAFASNVWTLGQGRIEIS